MLANDAQRLFGAPFRFEIAKVQAKALATVFKRTRAEYGKADQFMPERHRERHRHTGGFEIDNIQTNAARFVVVRWRIHECTPLVYPNAYSRFVAANGTVGRLISDVLNRSGRNACNRAAMCAGLGRGSIRLN